MILKYRSRTPEKVEDREPIPGEPQHWLSLSLMNNSLLQPFVFYQIGSHLSIEVVPPLNLIVSI